MPEGAGHGEDMPDQNNTFWYDSPRDMLAKLDREIQSLSKIDRLDNHRKADTVLNAAITAWQLSDWVKSTITDTERTRISIAYGGSEIDDWLLDRLFRGNQNVHICRQLATAGKHVSVGKHHDPYVMTYAALNFDFVTQKPALEWMISVDHMATTVTVWEVLAGAHEYWSDFLNLMSGASSR